MRSCENNTTAAGFIYPLRVSRGKRQLLQSVNHLFSVFCFCILFFFGPPPSPLLSAGLRVRKSALDVPLRILSRSTWEYVWVRSCFPSFSLSWFDFDVSFCFFVCRPLDSVATRIVNVCMGCIRTLISPFFFFSSPTKSGNRNKKRRRPYKEINRKTTKTKRQNEPYVSLRLNRVLPTQRHQQYPQCPSWFILERYQFCCHRQWDKEKPNAKGSREANQVLAYRVREHNKKNVTREIRATKKKNLDE